MVAGLIYNPANDDLFTAERGKGAFLNDQRLRVAARRRLADAVIACGLPHLGRGDVALGAKETAAVQAKVAGPAPVRRRLARSRLGRGRPARRLLGAQPVALGHRGGHRSWCARPAATSPTSMAARRRPSTLDVLAGNETIHGELLKVLKAAGKDA